MVETTTVEVQIETYRRLSGRKNPGDSFDDVIRRLLDQDQGERGDQEPRGDDEGAGTALTCDKCGHSWVYSGSAKYATCPSCKSSVKSGL